LTCRITLRAFRPASRTKLQRAAELLEMSSQLANIEAQRDVLGQESAQQQRRIGTNRGGSSPRSRPG
jgi:hypothetical protein